MAIRFIDKPSRRAQLAASLAGAVSTLTGTNVPPANRTGILQPQLAGAAAALTGLFAPSPARTGQLTQTLAGARSSFNGTVSLPAGSGDPTTLPLVQSSDFTYLGGLALPNSWPSGSNFTFQYGRFGCGFYQDPVNGPTLFVQGWSGAGSTVGQVKIPATPVKSASFASLPVTPIVQAIQEAVSGTLDAIDNDPSGQDFNNARYVYGLMVDDAGRLIIGANFYYANSQIANITYKPNTNLSSSTAAWTSFNSSQPIRAQTGYFAKVPPEWQSLLGGPWMSGMCTLSVISSSSTGAAVGTFNPADLGVVTQPVQHTLLQYPIDHPQSGGVGLGTESQQAVLPRFYNNTCVIRGMCFVPGTRSVLFFGAIGSGCYWYGAWDDPNSCGVQDLNGQDIKGPHAPPYSYYCWAYDANDLVAVKNGTKNSYDPIPYAVWEMPGMPFADSNKFRGATFDQATGQLYIFPDCQTEPRIEVWQIKKFAATPSFPLVYSADKRYLVDASGNPWFMSARTSWNVISLSVANYQSYLADNLAKNFNGIECAIPHRDPRSTASPKAGNGAAPFLKLLSGAAWDGSFTYGSDAPDFTTPNETFWSYVDTFLAYCESNKITVNCFPSYVGFNGTDQGWMAEMLANGATRMQAFGAFFANRYKGRGNLVYMYGGDKGTAPFNFSSAELAVEQALVTGLKSISGQKSLHSSAEWQSGSIASDQTTFGASMTLNGIYSWEGVPGGFARRAYGQTPVIPVFQDETIYDKEGPDGNNANPNATQPVRRCNYWSWLNGATTGYTAGNGYVWLFNHTGAATDYDQHLNDQGAKDCAVLNAFVKTIPWQKLVPSGLNGMATLITVGAGTIDTTNCVVAAASPGGDLMVVYASTASAASFTANMAVMTHSSSVVCRWMDPTTGAFTAIGTFTNTGTRVFTKPTGNNAGGQTDWILVAIA